MHAVAGNAGERLAIAGVFDILSDRVRDLMLLRMTVCASLYAVGLEIERIDRVWGYVAFETLPVFHRHAPDRFQCLLHQSRPLLRIFVTGKTDLRFLHGHVLLL